MGCSISRIKLPASNHVQIESSNLSFLDLNDECLMAILEQLQPEDLCSMSFTCQQMQKLASKQFRQTFSKQHTGEYIIRNKNNKQLVEFHGPNYLKYFSKHLRSVTINGNGVEMENVITFLQTECGDNLNQINFNVGGIFDAICCKKMANQLKCIKTIQIKSLNNINLYDGLLKYCENVQKIEITNFDQSDFKWIHHNYPMLKTICFTYWNGCDRDTLEILIKQFIQRHPNLKEFIYYERYKTIRILINGGKIEFLNLKYLFEVDLSTIRKDRAFFCDEKSVKRFEIKLSDNWSPAAMDMLVKFNDYQPIHGVGISTFNGLNSNWMQLSKLKHLTDVTIRFYWKTLVLDELYGFLKHLSIELPNLKSFNLCLSQLRLKRYELKLLTMPFVRYSNKLSNLMIQFEDDFDCEPNDLFELNAARKLLTGACNMQIQIRGGNEMPHLNVPPNTMVTIEKFDFNGVLANE